jgi:hypothetical protein
MERWAAAAQCLATLAEADAQLRVFCQTHALSPEASPPPPSPSLVLIGHAASFTPY